MMMIMVMMMMIEILDSDWSCRPVATITTHRTIYHLMLLIPLVLAIKKIILKKVSIKKITEIMKTEKKIATSYLNLF